MAPRDMADPPDFLDTSRASSCSDADVQTSTLAHVEKSTQPAFINKSR